MSILVGIDLGTTNTVVSYWKRGKAQTIEIDGSNTFPSVISIKDGQVLSGMQAKSRLLIDPANSISSTKRDMGTDAVYTLNGKKMTPIDVSCEILRILKLRVEEKLGEKISQAIITVPAYFKSEQREATLMAAKNAGLEVLRLIPEPTAAAIAYGLNQGKAQTIMVYDLGGGTFDISIMKVKGNDFEVIAVDGDSRLGGDDFDDAISKLLYKQITKDTGEDVEYKKERPFINARQKVKEASEKAKIELSEKEYIEIIIPNLIGDYSLEFELTLKEYSALIRPLLNKTIDKIKNVLKQAKMTSDDIDRVILVGGSTKSPLVKEIVKREIRDPYMAQNVDEVVSNGAAILAANLGTPEQERADLNLPDIYVKEKTVHSYGIDLIDRESKTKFYNIIAPRGSLLPLRLGMMCYTSRPHQTAVAMNVYRGECKELSSNEKLGSLILNISTKQKYQVPVGAIFEIDENMIITFTSVELGNNNYTKDIIDDAECNDEILNIKAIDQLISENKIKYNQVNIDAK
jgi:molecular chaperone DnaK (HSP70)